MAGGLVVIALVLNRRLYFLLFRRGGPRLGLAGLCLHAVHHLTAVSAVPVAIVIHARTARTRRG